MIPVPNASFYQSYPKHYFRLRAIQLLSFWQDLDGYVKPFEDAGVERKEVITCLKLEIRGVFFQAIETLFELIFALETMQDENIWQVLVDSNGDKNYKRIKDLSEGSGSNITFLDKQLRLPSIDKEIPFELTFLQYVFYFVHVPDISEDDFHKTLDFIRDFLVIAAKEFSDRGDYNAYKHGLRLFPTIVGIEVSNLLTSVNLDFGDTYTTKKKNEPYNYYIKTFDIDRDLRMIVICSELITNIINARERYYFPNTNNVRFFSYGGYNIQEMTSPNLKATNIKFSITPVFNETNAEPKITDNKPTAE